MLIKKLECLTCTTVVVIVAVMTEFGLIPYPVVVFSATACSYNDEQNECYGL